jgi:hypothetical protein
MVVISQANIGNGGLSRLEGKEEATGHLLGSRRHATSFVLVPSDGMFGEEAKRGGEVLTHCFSRSQGIASSESARNYIERFNTNLPASSSARFEHAYCNRAVASHAETPDSCTSKAGSFDTLC